VKGIRSFGKKGTCQTLVEGGDPSEAGARLRGRREKR